MYKFTVEFAFKVLLVLSVTFWVLTVVTTEYTFSDSVFSYFYCLPWSYWLSLSILIFLLALRLNSNIISTRKWVLLDLLLIFIFMLVLFGTACFIEKTPRMFDVYGHTGTALIVNSTGSATTSLSHSYVNPLNYAANYPGFFVFLSVFWSVTGLSWITTVQYYPIFLMLIISFLIYIIARRFSSKFVVLAPILFLSFSWFQEFHSSPQSLGLILYVVFFLILSNLLFKNDYLKNKRAMLISFVIVLSSIIISHPGTPIFIILNSVFLGIILLLQNLIKLHINLNKTIVGFTLAVCLVLFLGWGFYNSSASLGNILKSISYSISSLLSSVPSLKSISTFSADYILVNFFRLAAIGLFNIFVLLSGLLLFFQKKVQQNVSIVLIAWVFSCWAFLLYSLGAFGTYMERSAMFGLIPGSILLGFFFETINKKHVKVASLVIVLLVAGGSFILPITRNANDAFETPTLSYLGVASFIGQYTYNQIGINMHSGVIGTYGIIFNNTSLEIKHFKDDYLFPKDSVFLFDQPSYSREVNTGNITYYSLLHNSCDLIFPKVFDNHGSQLYINSLDRLNISKFIGEGSR